MGNDGEDAETDEEDAKSDEAVVGTDEECAQEDAETHENACKICHGLRVRVHPGGLFSGPYKEYETSVTAFEKVAKKRQCWHCTCLWEAFTECPPKEGWPPNVKIRYRRSAENCFEFGITSDKNTKLSELEDYKVTSQDLADVEYNLEVYNSLRKYRS